MEFPFDINPLFPERVSVLDHHLQPGRRSSSSRATLENQLAVVLDKMGEASAKAQQLSAAITNASRMQVNRHRLYILKDSVANRGRGAAIGFLKVGNKKLFVLDGQGTHHEMEPLCVLDFYVHVSLQRHGYGKELFDYMIQVNNFVVFDSFFRDRQLRRTRLVHRSITKKVEQDIKPYSITVREGAPQEQELPWPFNQSPSLMRSNSLGCSSRQQEGARYVRGVRPPALNGTREQDDSSVHKRRTSAGCVEDQEEVSVRSEAALHTTSSPPPDRGPPPASEPGLHQDLSGQSQQPVFRGTIPCRRDSSPPLHPVPPLDLRDLPGVPGSPEKRPSTSSPLQDPPPAPRGQRGQERHQGDPVLSPGKERGVPITVPDPWSEAGIPSQAQWIRHKNKFRNTRPW
ncbi:alpha-tubulin N-acetyltransferase 1 isoform X2 [Leucoraja erinacea]|uniref:alpha-tubulin N-acetyltransferase 1 isoform X2 n=1 Tax=Leucoraja erinaceus TaxID=7782 RepID=UPI002458DC15|nr:alpha-tubulin N-acetyltransferase 1 isoform X2 [Leucoraja erinacea]